MLLQFELILFDLLIENPKLITSMVSGFLDVSPSPKTNYLFFETPGYFTQAKKNKGFLKCCVFNEFRNLLEIHLLTILEKTDADK